MKPFTIRTAAYRDQYCRFMNYLLTVGYRKASRKTFAVPLREFLEWLEERKLTTLDQVQQADIENYHSHQEQRPNRSTGGALSESRVAIHLYAIRLFFSYLQDTEQIHIHPMSQLNYIQPFKRTRENLLSPQDIEELYHCCDTSRQRAILSLAYGCGLRREEAVNLNVKDIHFKSACLYVREGKGGRKRIIPLTRKVVADLEAYCEQRAGTIPYHQLSSTPAFILNKHGVRMQGPGFNKEVKKLIRKAGLDPRITLHHFRHAIATHLLEGGMDMRRVKDFLGHGSIETTQTYTHITTTQLKKITHYGTEPLPL